MERTSDHREEPNPSTASSTWLSDWFEEQYDSEFDSVLTTQVQTSANDVLQSKQKPGVSEAELGKIVRDVFGPDVQRRRTKHKGKSVYKYFGLKRKLEESDNEGDDSAKKACSSDLSQPLTTERLFQRVKELETQLADETEARENLSARLREATVTNQVQQTDHQMQLQQAQEEQALLKQQLHATTQKSEQENLALRNHLELSYQRKSSLENELQQATLTAEEKQQAHEKELELSLQQKVILEQKLHETACQAEQEQKSLHKQLELSQRQQMPLIQQLEEQKHQTDQQLVLLNSLQQTQQQKSSMDPAEFVPWDTVMQVLDSELVSLRRVKGMLSSGPIDHSDRRSIQDFQFKAVKEQLMEHMPHLSSLLFSIGQFSEEAARPQLPIKDVHSISALCVLAKKDSNQVKGFQTLVGLMLLARATNKQVITDLNHIGISISYSEILRLVEETATSIDTSTDIQHGTWIVAYDNVNFRKKVFHERIGRHDESWDFTSRLATKVMHLPPEEFLCTASTPQGPRSSLEPEDLLPTDSDDDYFLESAKRYIKNLLINYFRSCHNLPQSHNPRLTHKATKSIIHPMALMDIDSSYIDNNVAILVDFQRRLRIDGMMQQCVVGDQATCSTIRGARRRRVAEFNPADRLSWAKENPGDFHFTWECLKVIFLLFWGSPDQPGSLAQLRETVNRKTVTSDAKRFQQADEFLHHVLDAHLISSLLDFLGISDESDPLPSQSQEISWIDKMIDDFVNAVVAVPRDEHTTEADHIYNCHRSFLHSALLYHDLRDAIKYDDGPGIIRHWKMWLLFFLASGRKKYSGEAANLLANLKADFSKWMSYLVTHNRTVNTTGLPGHGKPIDMAVEHHNLIIKNALRSSGSNITEHHLKVISLAAQMLQDSAALCDIQVQSPLHSRRHTSTEVHPDIKKMVSSLRCSKVTSRIPERKLPPDRHFTIPLSQGYHKAMAQQWLRKFLQKPELQLDRDQNPQEVHEDVETSDDLPFQ